MPLTLADVNEKSIIRKFNGNTEVKEHSENLDLLAHKNSLSRELMSAIAVLVILAHVILIVMLLRRAIPLLEVGGGGGGGGGGNTLYVSVLQSSATPPKAVQEAPKAKESESELITTTAESKHTINTVKEEKKIVKEKVEKTEKVVKPQEMPKVAEPQKTDSVKEAVQGSGSGTGSGIGSGTGSGTGAGVGSGSGTGIGDGSGGGFAKSVSLSQLRYKKAAVPEYPSKSIERNEMGTVKIRVLVGVDGKVNDAKIVASSGYGKLDQAALKAARRSSFYPYVEGGRAYPAMAIIPYKFDLNEQR